MDAASATPSPVSPPRAPPVAEIKTQHISPHHLVGGEVTASETVNGTHMEPPHDGPGAVLDPQLLAYDEMSALTATTEQPNGNSIGGSESAEHVVDILHELTTSVGINAELQCTLCHEVLCKPVTTPCGHSFCRVCLVEYLLSKELDETQCPICRGLVLHTSMEDSGDTSPNDAAPIFCINVTLWNLIQLLVPALRTKDPVEEDADYALKYDQFDAKWRIATLQQSALNGNRRRRQRGRTDEIESSDDEMQGGYDAFSDADADGDTDAGNLRHRPRYPELRQENTMDGHLEVFRNVVLDRDDANDDGYEAMRVSLAIMEFPSLFQPFNEHQECSIVVLKCEEDEDMDGGIPYFTSDDGDDDALIITDYYNEIRLRVIDHEGNAIMERTRGATQGIVTFPNLRLDVPSGMYDFQFRDDLYGVRLTIRTEVRDLRDQDGSFEIENGGRPVRLILDQAGERNRSRRRRRHGTDQEDDDEEDDDPSESGSDDSFIVNDDEEVGQDSFGAPRFSGDESEGSWSSAHPDEDDEEGVLERIEQSVLEQRRQRQREQDDQSSLSSQLRGEDGYSSHTSHRDLETEHRVGAEGHEIDGGPSQGEQSEEEDDACQLSSVPSARSVKRNRIVDDDSESEQSTSETQGESSAWHLPSRYASNNADPQANRKRSRAILESEDEHGSDANEESKSDGDEEVPRVVEPVQGFSSNKRIRNLTSRMFQDDDDEEEEGDAGGIKDNENAPQRARWIGSDPYWSRDRGENANGTEDEDESQTIVAGDSHVCSGEACNDCYDAVDDEGDDGNDHENDHFHSQSEDEDAAWTAGNEIEHDGDEDGYSE